MDTTSAEEQLRRRKPEGSSANDSPSRKVAGEVQDEDRLKAKAAQQVAESSDHVDSEEEKFLEERYAEEMAKNLPQGTDKTPGLLEHIVSGLPDRWRNWVIRFVFTFLMITTLLVQVQCFQEIISIGYSVYRIHGLPWFRSLSWYFLFTSNYFFYGENLVDYFGYFVNKVEWLRLLIKYHRFLSFSLYCIGFVWFVLSLTRKYYMRQFSLFAWTHVALLIVVTQSYLIIENIFQGLIWFIVPVSMIVCNDVMAYVFGFFFGKTPLIKLSPKKTWEGFIGGGFSTVIFGLVFSYFLCQFSYFICPVGYDESANQVSMACEPNYLFVAQEYVLPKLNKTITMYPFMLHSLSLSLFSSVIGPFGGFFASGFKRAFKIKDFGDMIPGHGGIMDRFDCQFLMATFVNVYITSFIRSVSPQKLLAQIFQLKPEQQLELFNTLRDNLEHRDILNLT